MMPTCSEISEIKRSISDVISNGGLYIPYKFSLMSDLMTLSIASTDLRSSEIDLSANPPGGRNIKIFKLSIFYKIVFRIPIVLYSKESSNSITS